MMQRDINNVFILKNILPNDIIMNIHSFIIDYKYFKNEWDNRMLETLSIIDKGYKYVPVYILPRYHVLTARSYEGEYYCAECYLNAFINKKSYVDKDYCNNCYQIFMINRNIHFEYRLLSFEEFQQRDEIRNLINIYNCRNITIFINSNKFLTEMVLSGNPRHYKSKYDSISFAYEIKQIQSKLSNLRKFKKNE